MKETVLRVVRAYRTGRQPSSIVVIVPAECGFEKGQKFLVKRDKMNRLIYEPIAKEAKDEEWKKRMREAQDG